MKVLPSMNPTWVAVSLIVFVFCSACERRPPAPTPAAAKQTHLEWSLKTTVAAYDDFGEPDAKWDEPARRALTEFANLRARTLDENEPAGQIISTNAAAAMRAGCRDPLVRYLYIRYAMDGTNSPQDFAEAFRRMDEVMEQSYYPPVRKFYAALRTMGQLYDAYGTNVDQQVITVVSQNVMNNLAKLLADRSIPPAEIFDACTESVGFYKRKKSSNEFWYDSIAGPLFTNRMDEPVPWLIKGIHHLNLAWFDQFATPQEPEAAQAIRTQLAEAEKSLLRAWKLNPKDSRIADMMILLTVQRGDARKEMELWFKRAMDLNPNSYDAATYKMLYLEPNWHGTVADMIEFGHECVQNKKWGGTVPTMLDVCHQSIYNLFLNPSQRVNYWQRADVWSDLKATYERLFEVNPEATGWYHNYAWRAYQAGQWQTLNEIIPKLGPVNYSFFGGQDVFDEMIRQAKSHAASTR